MRAQIVADIQAVVDRLKSEGHTATTKLENALHSLKELLKKEASYAVEAEKPVLAEVEKNLAEAEDLAKVSAKK